MQLKNEIFNSYAKTKIICHGARASRISERLIRRLWKYIKNTEFVKGSVSDDERMEMLSSISLEELISYPCDLEKTDTVCDIVYQIIFEDDDFGKLSMVSEKFNKTPNIVLVIGDAKMGEPEFPYICVEEGEITDTFLDIFSVYSFPQEYGADFEELRPLFEYKGQILTEKGEGFNLCVFRKPNRDEAFSDEIKALENEKGFFILTSRISESREIKYYSRMNI